MIFIPEYKLSKSTRVGIEMDFYKLLDEIKKHPGLYLTRPSIYDLSSFLLGYELARSMQGVSPTEEEREFYGFLEWLKEKFPIKTHHSWVNIIMFYSYDERDSLDIFFDFFEYYKKHILNSQELEESDDGFDKFLIQLLHNNCESGLED